MAIVGIAALCALAGGVGLTFSPLFDARRVDVTGTWHLRPDQVRRLSGVTTGTDVFWLDRGAIERRLEADPWIASATVERSLPSRVRIVVVERVPVAIVGEGAARVLVAGDGTPLGPADPIAVLPAIVSMNSIEALPGPWLRGAARALASLDPRLRSRVAEVTVNVDGDLTFRLSSGTRVHYGPPSDFEPKAQSLRAVLDWVRTHPEPLVSIELEIPEVPTARSGTPAPW